MKEIRRKAAEENCIAVIKEIKQMYDVSYGVLLYISVMEIVFVWQIAVGIFKMAKNKTAVLRK